MTQLIHEPFYSFHGNPYGVATRIENGMIIQTDYHSNGYGEPVITTLGKAEGNLFEATMFSRWYEKELLQRDRVLASSEKEARTAIEEMFEHSD